MITLGVDHGLAKIGLAVSDELGMFARPLPVLKVKNQDEALEGVLFLAQDFKVECIVIGVPSSFGDSSSKQTEIVTRFVEKIKKNFNGQVATWDESYTTKQAEKGARGRKRANSDSEAARIILQEYLDNFQ